jgi:hypothetical protein
MHEPDADVARTAAIPQTQAARHWLSVTDNPELWFPFVFQDHVCQGAEAADRKDQGPMHMFKPPGSELAERYWRHHATETPAGY